MTEDQNWISLRAQDFHHDVNAGRSDEVLMDDLWGSFSGDDDSSSDSGESDDVGCEMPGLTVPGSESNEFAPYPSKTVSKQWQAGKGNN
jgi:hypothetical protein